MSSPPLINDAVPYLPTHPTKQYRSRQLEDIDTLVIHHTVGLPFGGIVNIAYYHVRSKNWPGIGYHYIVNVFGQVYQVNQLETVSYHASASNSHSVGIGLQGNFTHTPPPQAQLEAAQELVNHLVNSLSIKTIQGHKDTSGSQTACPGATWPDGWHIT